MKRAKVPIPADVLEGLEAVRLSGRTNMLDVPEWSVWQWRWAFPKQRSG